MSLWRQITHGFHALTHQRTADREVADEVRHFYEQAERELREPGMSASEAQRTARIELGDGDLVREEVRTYGWENLLTTVWSDLAFAWHQLWRYPGFTVVALLTLALGIGASTIIFSAIDPVLLRPLPYPVASRLMVYLRCRRGVNLLGVGRRVVVPACRAAQVDPIVTLRSE